MAPFERDLPVYDGEKSVIFLRRSDRRGVVLREFSLDGVKFQTESVLSYQTYGIGLQKPGASQIGLYEVSEEITDELYLALIKDREKANREWEFTLVDINRSMETMMLRIQRLEHQFSSRFGLSIDLEPSRLNRQP